MENSDYQEPTQETNDFFKSMASVALQRLNEVTNRSNQTDQKSTVVDKIIVTLAAGNIGVIANVDRDEMVSSIGVSFKEDVRGRLESLLQEFVGRPLDLFKQQIQELGRVSVLDLREMHLASVDQEGNRKEFF